MPIDHLPDALKPPAEKVRDRFLTDAGGMIILGIIMIIRSISYHFLGDYVLVNPIDTHLSVWWTSGYWMVMGVALIIASWWQSTPVARFIFALGVATFALWGSLYIFSPAGAFQQRGVIYLGIATMVVWAVWRGRRGEIRVRKGPPYADIAH